MDDYMYEWMTKIRWADLRGTADAVALCRHSGAAGARRNDAVAGLEDGRRRRAALRRRVCQALALAAVLWVWGMGATLAWGHGGHPHGARGRHAAGGYGEPQGGASSRRGAPASTSSRRGPAAIGSRS